MDREDQRFRVLGRAAGSNDAGRFERHARVAEDDGWAREEMLPVLRTSTSIEVPRRVITYNRSPDLPFDRSINPYRGCEHGCVYCFARPSHAYLGLSPGLDFETRLIARPEAPEVLKRELAAKKYQVAPIAIGTNTDPYQPIEARYRITRQVLEVCLDARHPVTITTKSDRVLADLDLLAELAERRLVAVAISVPSLDPKLSGKLEPRAAAPAKRLQALGRLAAAGVPTHCSVSPIIPAITDYEIEAIMAAAADAGAIRASYILMRLPFEVAPLFRAWLAAHYPDRADKVMHMVQEIRGGRDNDPDFFTRMRGHGVWAQLIRTRVKRAAREHGMDRSFPAIRSDLFRPPERDGQMELF